MGGKKKKQQGNGEYRNRIVGYGEEPTDSLLANPNNWRVHGRKQRDALEGVLNSVGWVQPVIVNRRTNFVVDGHLRVMLALRCGTPSVPVAYVDLTEGEEALILATYDPIGEMSKQDQERRKMLFESIQESKRAAAEFLYRKKKLTRLKLAMKQDDKGLRTAPVYEITLSYNHAERKSILKGLTLLKKWWSLSSNVEAFVRACRMYKEAHQS
jgi:hypothetical protein